MSRQIRSMLAGLVLVGAVGISPERADACSICLAGDPIFTSQGTAGHRVGEISTYLEYRNIRKKSGPLPGEPLDHKERNNSQRLDLFISMSPVDRVTLSVKLPWLFNEVTEIGGDEGPEESNLSGFGDMIVNTSVVLWRNRDVLPTTVIDGRAFIKFPTGATSQRRNGHKDPHLQVGTGSYDMGLGVGGVHRFEWGTLFGSVSGRINQEGTLDYEYGDVVLANLGVEAPVGKFLNLDPRAVVPGVELNFRNSGRDRFEGVAYEHSGGNIVFVTPSLRVRLPWPFQGNAPQLRGAVQIPLGDHGLNGFQDEEDPVWLVGLQFSFDVPLPEWGDE